MRSGVQFPAGRPRFFLAPFFFHVFCWAPWCVVHNGYSYVPGPDISVLYCWCALLYDVRLCICIYPLCMYSCCCFPVCCYPAAAAVLVLATLLCLAHKKVLGQTSPKYHLYNCTNKYTWRIMLTLTREQQRRLRFRPGFEPSSRCLDELRPTLGALIAVRSTSLARPGPASNGLDFVYSNVNSYQADFFYVGTINKQLGSCPMEKAVRWSSPGFFSCEFSLPFVPCKNMLDDYRSVICSIEIFFFFCQAQCV